MTLFNRESQSPSVLPVWKWQLVLCALWMIPGILIVAQVTFGPSARPRPHSWGWELFFQLLYWEPLALATPFIFYLSRQFPFEVPRRGRAFGFHLVAGIIFGFVYALVLTPVSRWAIPDARIFESLQGFLAGYIRMINFTLLFGPMVYWMLVGVGHAVVYAERLREGERQTAELTLRTSQLETQLANARLLALKMQLHPHFLFNTLHSIAALVRENDARGAIRMIAGLSDLLRWVLDQSDNEQVPLRQELEFLEKYLEIEQIRFQDRLTVYKNIAPETLDASVPHLILQPLVENAVRHGISKRIAASRIEINTWRENGRLCLQINDDGPGLPPDFIQTKAGGLGLRNVEARLQGCFGSDHDFVVETIKSGGTSVLISIPFTSGRNCPGNESLP